MLGFSANTFCLVCSGQGEKVTFGDPAAGPELPAIARKLADQLQGNCPEVPSGG